MKIASNIITRMKTTFNRDITDPRQREMILGDTLKQFAKKMDMAQDNDAYSLLDQLAMEYESIKIDPMEIYYKAFELYQNEKRLLQTIVGFLRSRDAKDKKAIHYYQKLSNAEPENFQMLALLVECYKENNESVPLMMTYERIIKKFRELEESRRWGAHLDGDWAFIQSQYQNSLLCLGDIYAEMGKSDEDALSVYREIIRADEPNATAIKILAKAYMDKERTDQEAMEVYEYFLAYEPYDRNARLLLARGFIDTQRLDEGISILKSLSQEFPEDAEINDFLIQQLMAHNLINEDTAVFFVAYLQRHPENKQIVSLLANHFAEVGSLSSQAIALYEKYVVTPGLHPSEKARYYELLGRYHVNNQTWAKVIEIYEILRGINPLSKSFIIPLASGYCEYGRTDEEALKVYKEAIHLGSRNEKIHNLICQYFYNLKKQTPASVKIFKDSLNVLPKNRFARLGLCRYYLYANEYENGLNEALKHLRFYSEEETAMGYAADCLSQMDDKRIKRYLTELDDGLRRLLLEKTFEKKPNVKTVALELSEIYQKEKRMDDFASKVYLSALPYDKFNTDLLTLLSNYYRVRGDEESAFRYDIEIFRICRCDCGVFASKGKKLPIQKNCTGACMRIAHHILSTNKVIADGREILRCAWRLGDKSHKLVRRLADYYFDEDSYSDEAVEIYQALAAMEPNNQEARRRILRAKMFKGDTKSAFLYCEEQLKLNPEDNEALDFLIQCLKTTTETEDRITNFIEKMQRKRQDDPRLCYALALIYSHQQNYNLATLGVFINALQMNPDDLQILGGVARCYEFAGNYERAAETYEKILQTITDKTTIIKNLAHSYMHLRRIDKDNVALIQKAIASDPRDKDLHFFLADYLFKIGETQQGGVVLDRFIQNQPAALDNVINHLFELQDSEIWKPELHIKLGYYLIEDDRIEEALDEFSQLSTSYTRYCGDLAEGYNRILQQQPRHVRTLVERGVLLKILGDFEEAVEDLEKARNIDPQNPNVLFELAECYEAYIAMFRDPPLPMLYKTANLYFELEEYDKAIKAYQQILNKDKESREAVLTIGKCFFKKGELGLAYQYFLRLDMSDEVKELLYQLGEQFYASGDPQKTIEVFNQILAADIAFKDVYQQVNALRAEVRKKFGMGRLRDDIMQQLSQRAQERFELMEEVGRGTMGVVFRAYDRELDEVVALKILSEKFSEDEDAQSRFRLEVKSTRRLSHQNIVRIHDIGEEAGRKYISMEYVDGGDLKKLIASQKRLQPSEAIEYGIQIASALSAAHALGILHRDIKPANILLTADKVCKLTDFGIATFLEEAGDISSDIIIGTPLYMSPEQNEGKQVSPASDIYSLGVVLYEMFMGAPPFRTGNIAYHHIFTTPPPMRGTDPKIEQVIMKCLEKKPSARYDSMESLLSELKTLAK